MSFVSVAQDIGCFAIGGVSLSSFAVGFASGIVLAVTKIVFPLLGIKAVCGVTVVKISNYAFIGTVGGFGVLTVTAIVLFGVLSQMNIRCGAN